MIKKGALAATIFALLFVPGAIPTFIAVKSAKYKKNRQTQLQNKE